MTSPQTEFDALLDAVRRGRPDAAERVWELVYAELQGLARLKLQDLAPGQTLQSTALVHEAWLRLSSREATWESRRHFFAAAARAMRNILVDRARRRDSLRRGGHAQRVPLSEIEVAELGAEESVLDLDGALSRLEAIDPRAARVVDLRYFAGLSIEETARVLALSHATVEREWTWARAWLRKELSEGVGAGEGGAEGEA